MRRYWRAETCVSAVDGTMSHNQWGQITWGLHFNDNTKSDVTNYTDTWHNITKIPMDKKLCIDEQVIPFKSKQSLTVHIKDKPKTRATNPFSCDSLQIVYNSELKRLYYESWATWKYKQIPSNAAMCDIWWPVPSTISHETENHVACQCHLVIFQCEKICGKDISFW
jgi:hypothetical protein